MTTIDCLLLEVSKNILSLEDNFSKVDKKILTSLSNQLKKGVFLTEKQANLLVKIFKENRETIKKVEANVNAILSENSWSKPFRKLERFRKIEVDKNNPNIFVLKFSFNTRLIEKTRKLLSKLDNNSVTSDNSYLIYLSEKNLKLVLDEFINEDFEIDEHLLNYYKEIKQIEKESKNFFEIFSTTNAKLKSAVINELGEITENNLLMIHDRKIKYQYTVSKKLKGNSLNERIANRPDKSVYANSEKIKFTEILSSIKDLDRFPLLLVFEGSNKKDVSYLTKIKEAVDELGLLGDIGIYFRYDTKDDELKFNEKVSNLEYNKYLGENTIIAGLANFKLPKFIVKNQWKPNSIISFTNKFKSNKSYVYFSSVDLIIYYTNFQNLSGPLYEL